jgi:hypothetical protein
MTVTQFIWRARQADAIATAAGSKSNLHSERAGWRTESIIAITRRADAHWTTQ